MAEINDSVRQTALFFLKKLDESGITPEKVYIFGSCAKGCADRFSDIDIAVISSDFSDNRFEERVRLMKISCDIDSRIEPVPFNLNTFIEEDPLVWEIMKTGTLIYMN